MASLPLYIFRLGKLLLRFSKREGEIVFKVFGMKWVLFFSYFLSLFFSINFLDMLDTVVIYIIVQALQQRAFQAHDVDAPHLTLLFLSFRKCSRKEKSFGHDTECVFMGFAIYKVMFNATKFKLKTSRKNQLFCCSLQSSFPLKSPSLITKTA